MSNTYSGRPPGCVNTTTRKSDGQLVWSGRRCSGTARNPRTAGRGWSRGARATTRRAACGRAAGVAWNSAGSPPFRRPDQGRSVL